MNDTQLRVQIVEGADHAHGDLQKNRDREDNITLRESNEWWKYVEIYLAQHRLLHG